MCTKRKLCASKKKKSFHFHHLVKIFCCQTLATLAMLAPIQHKNKFFKCFSGACVSHVKVIKLLWGFPSALFPSNCELYQSLVTRFEHSYISFFFSLSENSEGPGFYLLNILQQHKQIQVVDTERNMEAREGKKRITDWPKILL